METIEVRYKPIPGAGELGVYHKYILYTDKNGAVFYARGGPESRISSDYFSVPFPFGNIVTEVGAYTRFTIDWDKARAGDSSATPHPREVIASGDDLSKEWAKISERIQAINGQKIDYEVEDANSNSTVDEALREAGLPEPKMDGPEGYWSPGSGYDLPGGKIIGSIPEQSFLEDLTDWMSEKIKAGWDKFIRAVEDVTSDSFSEFEFAWGIDFGILNPDSAIEPALNSKIFNLDVNTGYGGANSGTVLGNVSSGVGLVLGGPNYGGAFNKEYVDENGLCKAAPSDQATGGIRAGNFNPSTVVSQVNDIRQQWSSVGQQIVMSPSDSNQASTLMVASDTAALSWESKNANGQTVLLKINGRFVKDGSDVQITGFYSDDGKFYVKLSSTDAWGGTDGKLAWYKWQTIDLSGAGRSLLQMVKADQTPYTDPLFLDGASDGVRMGAGPLNFDLNADGVAEPVRWASPTDSLLVLDTNGNGRIDNGTELVDLTNGDVPLNLLSLGSTNQGGNGDSKLTSADVAFSRLKLWTDRNQDGYASQGELQSLSDLGISSIELDPAYIQTGDVGGSTGVRGVLATFGNGNTHTLWDVPLALDTEAAAPTSVTVYAPNINKVTAGGESALLAMANDGVQIELQGSDAAQAI
ncbi:MAG: hypothetical protein RI920_392, partial [Pseudomonadota bacterium]